MLFLSLPARTDGRAAKVDYWRIERYCGSDRATARTAALLVFCSRAADKTLTKTGFSEMKTPGIEYIGAPPTTIMQEPCLEGFRRGFLGRFSSFSFKIAPLSAKLRRVPALLWNQQACVAALGPIAIGQ